jgi:hypothetical protein
VPSQTFSITAGADDGYVTSKSAGYPPTGTITWGSTDGSTWIERYLSGGQYAVTHGLFRFDTSSLNEAWTITGATLRLQIFIVNDADGRSVTADWYTFGLTSADHTNTAGTNAHAGTPLASLTENASTGSQNDLALANAGANVNKNGTTGLRLYISGGEPTGINNVELATLENTVAAEPQLIVEYTEGTVETLRPDAILVQTNDTKSLADLQRDVV